MTDTIHGPLVRVVATAVLVFLALPILVVFPLALSPGNYIQFPPTGISLRWVNQVMADKAWMDALWISLVVALITTALALVLSIMAALVLTRTDFPLKKVVYALILMPMILPGIITSVAMFFFLSQLGFSGSLYGMVIGHTVLALPVAVILLSATLQGVDQRLEQAALSLGASRFTAFRRITLPLIAPGLAAAAIFAFLSSFDELLVSMFLAGPGQETLPVRIWNSVLFQLDPSIAAVSALLVLVSVVALGATALLQRRGAPT